MSKKEISILAVLATLIAAAVIAVVAVRANRQPETVIGQFTPPPFASEPCVGTPDPAQVENLPYGTLTLKEGIAVSMVSDVAVNEQGSAEVWFTSHPNNTAWVMLRLMDEKGNVLAESGLLKPGQYIRALQLDVIPKRSGLIVARILTYEPETYFSLGSANAQVMLNVAK